MKKDKKEFYATVALGILIFVLYTLKFFNVCLELKFFAYLLIFWLDLILFLVSLKYALTLKQLRKNKCDNTMEYIKKLTNTKIGFLYFGIAFIITMLIVCICIYVMHQSENVFNLINFWLDILTALSTITVLIQRYISHTIHTYIEENEKIFA